MSGDLNWRRKWHWTGGQVDTRSKHSRLNPIWLYTATCRVRRDKPYPWSKLVLVSDKFSGIDEHEAVYSDNQRVDLKIVPLPHGERALAE